MFDIGLSELIVIMVIALLVIGPKKMPEVAKALGKGWAEFRHALDSVKEELNVPSISEDVQKAKDSLILNLDLDDQKEKPPLSGPPSPYRSAPAADETPTPSTPDKTDHTSTPKS